MEVTSYGQMDNIRSCGHYIVGGRSDRAMDSIHDVIQLILKPQEGKKLLKTSYTLNELRDLESKIVLITGTRAENRAAVNHFLDVRMWVILIEKVMVYVNSNCISTKNAHNEVLPCESVP